MNQLLTSSPIIPYIILVIGFVLLIKGADYFVDGCSSIAKLFKIPSIIIGLTIAALGTSAPEAAVSITSSLKNANDMSVSNVIGSNFFNLLVVIGICSLIKPINVSKDIIVRDYPLLIVTSVLMLLFATNCFTDGFIACPIGRLDGIILLALFVLYILVLIKSTLASRKNSGDKDDEEMEIISTPKSIIYIICGAVAIMFGGDFVVDSATVIAESYGLSKTLIGLTIVAVGTSLPELVTSVVAATKGENDLAIGNVVGSNLFNILFVLGIAATVSPINLQTVTDSIFIIYDIIILLAVTLISYVFILLKKNVNRIEGFIMTLMYIAYMAYIIIR